VTNLKLLNITSSNVTTLAINLKGMNHQKPNQLMIENSAGKGLYEKYFK